MAEPNHCLLGVKGRLRLRHQVCYHDHKYIKWPFPSIISALLFLYKVTSGTDDLMSPRPTVLLKTPASVFARSVVGSPQWPLTAPFTPDLDSPFASPALRRLTAPVEQCSPWSGTVQSPHIMRRAPKLWSTSTGERT